MLSPEAKIKVQNFGRFLSNMVMPNIGAFIAWGFITALFIPTGWWPNETLASMVGPMITYLLPLLIGYTGGKMVGGDRGAVVGAITTMGVIVGTDIPMFMGAMIVGPLGGIAIKKFDEAVHGKVKSGFEMLVNNFSAGIIGMICAIIAFIVIGPAVKILSGGLAAGVNAMVEAGALPLASIFVEPAKILFLNNAINHGIFSPLGIQQSEEMGRSIFFLIEANPGPGFGLLLAYMVFGKGSAKQSAAGASIKLNREPMEEYLNSNIKLMEAMIEGGYKDGETLAKRIADVKEWLANGELMEADKNAEYAQIIEIDLAEMTEPVVCCPNDPDDVKVLSDVQGDKVDEVFIGSCMTNVGLFRAAGEILKGQGQADATLWIAPPTKMDKDQLVAEGYYATFAGAGARLEMPGCSLCMGNQARVRDASTVFSTSTRNFNNRLGKDAQVYLGSSELAAVVALLGKMPTPKEYIETMTPALEGKEGEVYKYLNFHQMDNVTV